jgi:hypothetical protein
VSGVLEACKEVQRSKRLRKMLEIILAFGNYMNRGQRGNALGFKLNSLTRIADTKSSCNKNMTLLHFMADTCEKKVSVFFAGLRILWIRRIPMFFGLLDPDPLGRGIRIRILLSSNKIERKTLIPTVLRLLYIKFLFFEK